jgi:transposase
VNYTSRLEHIMMGRKVVQRERTELINLEEFVPQDHLLRAVDRYLDLSDFRFHLQKSYSHIGRPSVDPELIIRMLIIGYCYGIRSERRLCEEVHLNLAYRWFCHLGMHDRVRDHSRLSRRTGMAVSAIAMPFESCSNRSCVAASVKAWSEGKDLPPMRV